MKKDNPIPDQLESFSDRLRQVMRGHRTACACDGPPGVGKTHTLKTVATEIRKPYRIVSTTAGGLVQVLYQFRNHPALAFDDFDKALRNEATANIVKQMTAPETQRTITHQTVKAMDNLNRKNPKANIAPPTFSIQCGLIMLTNVDMSDPNAISKDMREHVRALSDRGLEFVHISRDRMHIVDYVASNADTFLRSQGITLSKQMLTEVRDFFVNNAEQFETVSVRRLVSIAKDRLTMPDRWKRLQEASFLPPPKAPQAVNRDPKPRAANRRTKQESKQKSADPEPGSSNKAPITWRHASDEWASPQDLFVFINGYFKIDVDVAATAENAKCKKFWTMEDDGLKQLWEAGKTYWMNPPYSKAKDWIKKADEAAAAGATVIGLLPNRSATRWYRDHVAPNAYVVQLHGRAKFTPGHREIQNSSAPFASILIIWPKVAAERIKDVLQPIDTGLMSLKFAA